MQQDSTLASSTSGKFPTTTTQIPTATTNPPNWTQFQGSNGSFTSLDSNGKGQTVESGSNVLSLDINTSKLILIAPTKKDSTDPKWSYSLAGGATPIMLYITGSDKSDQFLTINTTDSLLIGNIMIASKKNSGVTGSQSRTFGMAKMIFSGNGIYAEGDGAGLSTNTSLPTAGNYALVGAVINNNGGQVDVEFKSGAKMFGDIRATSASQAKNTFTFENGVPTDGYLFEGSISSAGGGSNIITFKSGDAHIHSVALGQNYGVLSQNNGFNTINFGELTKQSTSSQNLKTLVLLSTNTYNSSSSGSGFVNTKNTITFQNGQSGNKLEIYADSDRSDFSGYLRSSSAQNFIFTQDANSGSNHTKLDVVIDRGMVTQASSEYDLKDTSNHILNTIIIDGSASIGRVGARSIFTHGIVTYAGKSKIYLMETNGTTNDQTQFSGGITYDSTKSLETSQIYAGNYAKKENYIGSNEIKIDGDLTLSFANFNGGINGGIITATGGGSNTIEITGNLKTLEITSDMKTPTNTATTADNMRILASGSNDSHNTITINNKNNGGEDIALGSIYASGGTNFITMYGKNGKNVNVLYTSSSQEDDTIQGHNKLLAIDGSNVNFENISTQGGTNDIAVLTTTNQNTQTSNLKVSYGVAGTTNLYFGNVDTSGKTSDGVIKLSLGNSWDTSNLDIKVERGNSNKFDVTFGNGTDFSYFFGDIEKLGSGISNNKYFVENNAIFTPNTMGKTQQVDIDLTLKAGGKMVLNDNFSIQTLSVEKSANQASDYLVPTKDIASTVIDLATSGGDYHNLSRSTGRTLTVDTLTLNDSGEGNVLLRIYSGGETNNTDKVTVANLTATNAQLDTQVFLPLNLIGQDLSSKNLVIFSTTTGGDSLELVSKEAQTGFATYTVEITKVPQNGQQSPNGKTEWKLGKTQDAQIASGSVDFSNVIIPLNYTNWNSNINSLNKRMGELRDNPFSQGVWARVFVGEQSNTQGLAQIDMGYLTIQGGYDYAVTLDDAKNYIGLALSYGMASAQSERFVDRFDTAYQYDAKSSSIEVGFYNSYVQNSGLYTDSILKFSYISSDFNGINANSANTTVTNYALSFGQEVGYRLKFGEKLDWYFDPQFEGVFGYFSDTDFDQSFEQQVLNSTMNAMFLLRARVGADLGYSLKTQKGVYDFRAGVSYVYDYANGDAKYNLLNSSIATLSENGVITSDQRVVLNVGTNMNLNEEVRLYVDFETSFLGEINTKYQVNAGVRYSFGEKTILQVDQEEEKDAPLKLKDDTKKDKSQESKTSAS